MQLKQTSCGRGGPLPITEQPVWEDEGRAQVPTWSGTVHSAKAPEATTDCRVGNSGAPSTMPRGRGGGRCPTNSWWHTSQALPRPQPCQPRSWLGRRARYLDAHQPAPAPGTCSGPQGSASLHPPALPRQPTWRSGALSSGFQDMGQGLEEDAEGLDPQRLGTADRTG